MTKKANETQTVQLTAEQLQALGRQLSNILKVIEMDQLAQEGLTIARQHDTATFCHLATNYLGTSHEVFEQIVSELDGIAYQLMECDNAENLGDFNNDRKQSF